MRVTKTVALIIVLATGLALRCRSEGSIQSVTRVDDLEILGATTATGVITAKRLESRTAESGSRTSW